MIFRYDFNNVHHLACSEVLEMIDPQESMIENQVRKANLANCQFMTNLSRPDASFGVEKQHRNCVRSVAVEALVKTKFVKKEVVQEKLASGYRFTGTSQVAGKVVDEVFDRCYADLEPIGRRARYQYFFHA